MTRAEIETLCFSIALVVMPFLGNVSPIFKALPWYLSIGGALSSLYFIPFFRDHIKGKIKIDKFINEDVRYWYSRNWRNYHNELSIIGKMNTLTVNKLELAKSFKNYRGLLNPKKRCKIAFEEICVDRAVRAHKLFSKADLRDKIVNEIGNQVNSTDVNFILLSGTTANNSLKSKLETEFNKDVFSYEISDGKIQSTIPETYLENIPTPGCNIMVVESALFSPRLICRLVKYIDSLSDAYDKNFKISHAVTVFAAKGRAFEIRPEITTKALIEIDKGIRDGGTCSDCNWGECVSDAEIAKSYMVC